MFTITLQIGEWRKYFVSFGVDNSSYVHANNKRADILVFLKSQQMN